VKRILIIDDEKDFCFFVKKNLEEESCCSVAVCNNPNDAIAKAKEFHPDLIFLDVMMPEMDGGDLAELLRADPEVQFIPIVFLTALVTKDETKKGLNIIKGSYFLSKPVTTQELVSAVNELVK